MPCACPDRAGWAVADRGAVADSIAGTPTLTAAGAAYGHELELGPADAPWFRSPSLMPGVIVETLFLTDYAEAEGALSSAGQHALAQGVVGAIESYFRGATPPG
jgi:hypothetical protein